MNLFNFPSLVLATALTPLLAHAVTPFQLSDTAPAYTYSAKGDALPGSTNFDNGSSDWYAITYGDGKGSSSTIPSPWGTSPGQALQLSTTALPNGTGVQYTSPPIAFKKNRLYKISMKAGTCTNCSTTFSLYMMANAKDQPIPSAKTIKLTSTASTPYQTITLDGVFSVPAEMDTGDNGGWVRLVPQTAGAPIWIDDFKVEEIDANPLNFAERLKFGKASAATPIALDNKLFGIHINRLGEHNAWPALGQEVSRFWDTPTRWADIETSSGAWNFSELDYRVNFHQIRKPDVALIYTMGQSPSWASKITPTRGPCAYPDLPQACTVPNSQTYLDAWDDYVRTILARYENKIQYVEIWNEVDQPSTYQGDIQQLVYMTCHAKEILTKANSSIKVVAPSITSVGISTLDAFFALGGGDCVDIISYHNYFEPNTVESDIAGPVANVKFLMAHYGLGNKPLWNTEGAAKCVDDMHCLPSIQSTKDRVLRGTTPRAMAMQWANGVSNFNYHVMEATYALQPWKGLVQLPPAGSNCAQEQYGCVDKMPFTSLGQGFAVASKWLKSTKLYSAYVMPDQGIYIYKLRTASGAMRYLVWSTAATAQVVKAPLSWNIKTQSRTGGTTSTLFYSTAPIQLDPLDPVLLAP